MSNHTLNDISYHLNGIILFAERWYKNDDGSIYGYRDVKDKPDGKFRLEYATKDEHGIPVWKPCSTEGDVLREAEPFEKSAPLHFVIDIDPSVSIEDLLRSKPGKIVRG